LLYLYCFNKAIEFIFAGINIFWARLTFIFLFFFNSEKGPNIFMSKNINSVTIIITLKGIEKIKTEKNDNETVWTITRAFTSWMAFIFPQWKYTIHQANLVRNYKILPFEFSKIVEDMKGKFHKAYFQVLKLIVHLLDWHFSLVYFSGLKFLARQILHFSPQNAPQCPTK